ncbi:MAG TPA: STAS/SEC14 domain-containing protein [Polyangiaceae bacterium]
MLVSNLNEGKAILVVRYANPYDPADYAAYHKEFVRVVAAARKHIRPIVLLIDLQDGYPQPNAVQRKDIGEAWAKIPDVGGVIAIITSSALIRGIITAIEWFMKNSPTRRVTRAFSRSTDAVPWLAEQSGVSTSELNASVEALRTPSRVGRARP